MLAVGLVVAAADSFVGVTTQTPAPNVALKYTIKTVGGTATAARDCLILSNRTAAAVYFRFNGTLDGVTTVSATVYDLVLDQNEHEVIPRETLRNHPITTVEAISTTTPTLRIVGW